MIAQTTPTSPAQAAANPQVAPKKRGTQTGRTRKGRRRRGWRGARPGGGSRHGIIDLDPGGGRCRWRAGGHRRSGSGARCPAGGGR